MSYPGNLPIPYHAKIKPVYDISAYGQDLSIQLGIDNLALQSITASTATIFKSTDSVKYDGTATTVVPLEDMDLFLTDIDTFGIAHEGNNTAYNRVASWEPDMTAFVYKASVKMAFGLNVSAYTSGNFSIDSVTFKISQILTSDQTEKIDEFTVPATFTALTATGTQIFIIVADRHYTTFKAKQGRPIIIEITVNETTGSGTRQVGIMPNFPFQTAAILKNCTTSVLSVHLHPALDHAFPVFRDQDAMNLIDYSGTENPNGGGVG